MPWEQMTSLPATTYGSDHAVVSGKIYSIGGYVSAVTCYEYDPALNTWTQKANSSQGNFRDHQAAVLSGLIYLIVDADSNEIRRYNPASNTYDAIVDSATAWNGSVGQYCWAVSDGSNFYQGGGSSRTDVNRWNGASWTNALTTMSPATAYRTSKAVYAHDGNIYIFGGVTSGAVYTDQMLRYTPPTTWATRAPLGTAKAHTAIAAANPWVYVIGGTNASGNLDAVHRYDPALNTWTSLGNMPFNFPYKTHAAYVAPHLYVWGGFGASSSTALMYRIEAGYDEMAATLEGVADFHPYPDLRADFEASAEFFNDVAVAYDNGVEGDTFLDIGSTGQASLDALFPATDLYPDTTLYPQGDW